MEIYVFVEEPLILENLRMVSVSFSYGKVFDSTVVALHQWRSEGLMDGMVVRKDFAANCAAIYKWLTLLEVGLWIIICCCCKGVKIVRELVCVWRLALTWLKLKPRSACFKFERPTRRLFPLIPSRLRSI